MHLADSLQKTAFGRLFCLAQMRGPIEEVKTMTLLGKDLAGYLLSELGNSVARNTTLETLDLTDCILVTEENAWDKFVSLNAFLVNCSASANLRTLVLPASLQEYIEKNSALQFHITQLGERGVAVLFRRGTADLTPSAPPNP